VVLDASRGARPNVGTTRRDCSLDKHVGDPVDDQFQRPRIRAVGLNAAGDFVPELPDPSGDYCSSSGARQRSAGGTPTGLSRDRVRERRRSDPWLERETAAVPRRPTNKGTRSRPPVSVADQRRNKQHHRQADRDCNKASQATHQTRSYSRKARPSHRRVVSQAWARQSARTCLRSGVVDEVPAGFGVEGLGGHVESVGSGDRARSMVDLGPGEVVGVAERSKTPRHSLSVKSTSPTIPSSKGWR
jgi:hypothetical protein